MNTVPKDISYSRILLSRAAIGGTRAEFDRVVPVFDIAGNVFERYAVIYLPSLMRFSFPAKQNLNDFVAVVVCRAFLRREISR